MRPAPILGQAWLIALLPSTSSQQAAGGIGSEMTISIGTVTVSTAPGVGIALVKSAKGTSTASTTTAAFATAPAVGNLIVMGFATNDYNATPNAGWTQSGGAFDTADQHGAAHVPRRLSVVADQRRLQFLPVHDRLADQFGMGAGRLFPGVEASPNDVSAGQKNEGGISTSYTTLPITPPIGNRLLVAGINASLNNPSLAAVTVGGWTNSFTGIDLIGTGGVGTNDLASLAYRVVTSTGATAYSTGATFTPTTSTQSQTGLIISFGKVVTAARPTGSALTASTGTVSVRTTQNLSVTGNALTASVGGFSVHAGGAASVVLGGLVGRLTASVGSVFAPLNNAWNPATLFGPGALTNTDRTLSAPAWASLSRVFSTKTHLAGKYYAEVTIGGQPTGAVGFTDLTAEGAVIDLATGRVLVGSTVLTTFAPIVAGDVIGMALNVNTGHCWFRVNGGLWNNDPDQSPEFGDDPTVEFPTAATVGYRNAPGYPGFLTPYTGDNIIRETQRFEFMDFIGATIVAPNCEFYGCRFRSNWTDGWNIKVDVDVPLAATFQFCTIEPFSATIPNPAWPSAGTGINGIDGSSDPTYVPYMIPYASSYQYGILQAEGGIIVEDCDIWGFGNSICFFGVRQKTVVRCWIHDAANPGSGATLYHTDGPGHLNGSGCDNVLIRDCTIASLGNTNAIAFQGADRGYHNIIVRHNYLSGFSTWSTCATTAPARVPACSSSTTPSPLMLLGPMGRFTTIIRGSSARPTRPTSGAAIHCGCTPAASASPSASRVSAADNGKFIWPDITYHTTDWVP